MVWTRKTTTVKEKKMGAKSNGHKLKHTHKAHALDRWGDNVCVCVSWSVLINDHWTRMHSYCSLVPFRCFRLQQVSRPVVYASQPIQFARQNLQAHKPNHPSHTQRERNTHMQPKRGSWCCCCCNMHFRSTKKRERKIPIKPVYFGTHACLLSIRFM